MNNGGTSFDAMVQLDALSHALSLNTSIKSTLDDVTSDLKNAIGEDKASAWKDGKAQAFKTTVLSLVGSLEGLKLDLTNCSDKIADLAEIVKNYQDTTITSVNDID